MFLIQAKQQAAECKNINGGFKKDPKKGQINPISKKIQSKIENEK